MAPFDPVAKYGRGWKRTQSGPEVRVVIDQGVLDDPARMRTADLAQGDTVLNIKVQGRFPPFQMQ